MRLRLFVAGAFLVSASLAARADSLTETLIQSYSGVTDTVEDTGGIALFNPSLGRLNSVTQTLSGDIVFTPTGPGAFYIFNVNGFDTPIQSLITETTSETRLDVSATSGPNAALEGPPNGYGPYYIIEPFDLEVRHGSLSSVGNVVDSFTFNYTPNVASTPEPASIILLGTGLLGLSGVLRRRLFV